MVETLKDPDSARSAGQWTPGPWTVYDSHTGDYHIGKADEEIAEVFAGPTAEADARLIAAAPALLEALIASQGIEPLRMELEDCLPRERKALVAELRQIEKQVSAAIALAHPERER